MQPATATRSGPACWPAAPRSCALAQRAPPVKVLRRPPCARLPPKLAPGGGDNGCHRCSGRECRASRWFIAAQHRYDNGSSASEPAQPLRETAAELTPQPTRNPQAGADDIGDIRAVRIEVGNRVVERSSRQPRSTSAPVFQSSCGRVRMASHPMRRVSDRSDGNAPGARAASLLSRSRYFARGGIRHPVVRRAEADVPLDAMTRACG